MVNFIENPQIAATFIARVFLGVLFFFQGYDKVFNVKIGNVINTYQSSFHSQGIARSLTVAGAWYTSYIELIGGFLLILGLFKFYVLCLLGLDLIFVSIAFGITTPMWDMRYVFPRLLLLLFLLIVPVGWDYLSIDQLFFNN